MKKLWMMIPLLLTGLWGTPGMAQTSEPDLHTTIAYLMQYIAASNYTFIRNGKEHHIDEAVDHVKRKYDYFEDDIHTAEDFIRLCASESTMTGNPYMVKNPEGELIPTRQWLTAALENYRKNKP